MWLQALQRDDRGVALVTVILMGAVIVLLLSTMAIRTMSDIGQVRGDRLYEQALHMGDAGVEQTATRLGHNRFYTTPNQFPTTCPLRDEDERAWAVCVADAAALEFTEHTPGGEWVVVKPGFTTERDSHCLAEDKERDENCVIYSVGYTPTKASAEKVRVLKAEYVLGPAFSTDDLAVLAEGNVHLTGSVEVEGDFARVHANGTMKVKGSGGDAEGGFTAGVCDLNTAPERCQAPRHEDVPLISPRENYVLSEYDLCPDGKVRSGPSYEGPSPPNGTTMPCAGTELSYSAGWVWEPTETNLNKPDEQTPAPRWRYTGVNCPSSRCEAVFYVYRTNAVIASGVAKKNEAAWKTTLLIEGAPGPSEPHQCPHTTGSIRIGTNNHLSALRSLDIPGDEDAVSDLLIVSGHNIYSGGNARFRGALAAHERFEFKGGNEVNGILISNNACGTRGLDEDSEAEEVTDPTDVAHGSLTVTNNQRHLLPFGRDVHLTNWVEL